MIKVKNMNVTLSKKEILKDINFEINKGEIVGLLGPTSSGKTTLLRVLAGLEPNFTSSVKIDGLTPSSKTKAFLSILTETSYVPVQFSVKKLLNFYETFFPDFDRAYFDETVKFFNLDLNLKSSILKLSKGTLQLLRFSLCISRNAKVFLLDEPLNGMDAFLKEKVLQRILDKATEDTTLIISSHMIHDIEQIISSVLFIKDGKIVLQKDCDDLRSSTGLSIEASFKEVLR